MLFIFSTIAATSSLAAPNGLHQIHENNYMVDHPWLASWGSLAADPRFAHLVEEPALTVEIDQEKQESKPLLSMFKRPKPEPRPDIETPTQKHKTSNLAFFS